MTERLNWTERIKEKAFQDEEGICQYLGEGSMEWEETKGVRTDWEWCGGGGESVCSVMSASLWPHELQPARLLCPWDSPSKNIGVCCYFHLQGILPDLGIEPEGLVSPAFAGFNTSLLRHLESPQVRKERNFRPKILALEKECVAGRKHEHWSQNISSKFRC